MEADFGRNFLETSNKILKTTGRICKIALSLNRICFNFLNLWTGTTIPASLKKYGRNAEYLRPVTYCFNHRYE